ncbi:DNA polymerase alpha catalytic subunit [Anthonomus grandis grandis]|uniref:DNA polymerase alpha catalytic subunit n=1 Tax=Anthonomus grandis grandis TaxID=2921223 RepID=UPI002165475E|nr:DNA polymerase alpha catalytic subunit [Anthonomus grandis grandis]
MDDDSGNDRSRRNKRDSSYKAKAFEKFKDLKNKKLKYQVDEVDNIFETVDEREYTKRVLERQDDDWIVDDDGSGYVEDGRDIFDDDLDAESVTKASGSKTKSGKRRRDVSDQGPKGNIKYMLAKINPKKKEETQIQGDDMLSELLDEIDEKPKEAVVKPTKVFVPRKQVVQNYFKQFNKPVDVKGSKKVSLGTVIDDVEMDDAEKNDSDSTNKDSEIKLKREPDSQLSNNTISQRSDPDLDILDDDFNEIDCDEIIKKSESKNSCEIKPKEEIKEMNNTELELENMDDGFEDLLMKSDLFTTCNEITEANDVEMDAPFSGDDNKAFRFFWWDAFEDPEKQKGTVFLFGKTYSTEQKKYVSCCVAIKNVERQIFLLPTPHILDDQGKPTEETVTYKDLYSEFSEIADTFGIKTFKARLTQKKYAFDVSVPEESDYLEVKYSANFPKIKMDLLTKPPKTFSRIFGSDSSSIERFLINMKIKGPGWLEIKNPEFNKNPLSWCQIEVNCNSPNDVVKVNKNVPPPPLTVLTVNFRSHMNKPTNQSEILMITCVVQSNYAVDKRQPVPCFDQHFCVLTAPSNRPLPPTIHQVLTNYKGTKVQKMNNEQALLNYFITQFHKIDPDLVVGHNLHGYQADILAHRLIKHNISTFSKLSRLRRAQNKKLARELFTGRLVADVKISAKELIKARSYDLATLCQQVLKIPADLTVELEPDEVIKMFDNAQDIVKLINLTMQDTAYILKLMYDLNIVPLALQITNIAGNVMSRTLMGGRSERNEYLLLHAFHEKGYINPDKENKWKDPGNEEAKTDPKEPKGSKKKPTYSGGLVLDPKVGFYDKLLLLMDFNSLYPSIIQEYNICFTTIPVGQKTTTLENVELPDKNVAPGILPVEIRKLVDSRKQVKSLMAKPDLSPDLKMQYHIRQMALKLTANSMYGCLGFANSRFYAKNLAALVTLKGREILVNTKDLVEKMCFEVVYGDTDSIMINTNMYDYDQVLKTGIKIKQEVNKMYKMVELDVDGVFKYLLLLKKKKYAAVILSKNKDGTLREENEYKGLDIVRRDWSQLAAETGKYVLEQILSSQSEDDRISNIQSYLSKIKDDMKENKIPIDLLVITKQLTKDPRLYPSADSLPHVQVALRYNKERGGHFRAGDTVSYVICEDGTTKSATQRAYHPEELKLNEQLKIDSKYYLANQVHPVVTRICGPIEGLDAYFIAEHLGLDPTSFKRSTANKPTLPIGEDIRRPEVKFRDVDQFTFLCMACKSENTVSKPDVGFLVACSNSECNVKPLSYIYNIKNQLYLRCGEYVERYYENKLVCEDITCGNEITSVPVMRREGHSVCMLCLNNRLLRAYTEKQLYSQLSYFSYLFDGQNYAKGQLSDESLLNAVSQLRQAPEKYLSVSAYMKVNLSEIFSVLMPNKINENEKGDETAAPPEPEIDIEIECEDWSDAD